MVILKTSLLIGFSLFIVRGFVGMGLRNNSRISPCAFWARWADSLKTICERLSKLVHLLHARTIQIHANQNAFDASNVMSGSCIL